MSSTTTSLSETMSVYYDKRFLERAEEMMTYDVGAQTKRLPANEGKQVNWNRMTPLSKATSSLTEDSNPSFTDMTSTQVSASVSPYGAATKVSELYSLTSIDTGLEEHVDVHGQNAGETIDELIKTELDGNGTEQLAGGKSAASDVQASDTLDGSEVRTAARQLKLNKARKFPNDNFRGIVPVSATHDLRGASEWLDAHRYTDASAIRSDQIGRLHGVEFFETNNEKINTDGGSGTVDLYTTFIVGANSYGTVDMEGQPQQSIYVKQPDSSSTDNPLDQFMTVGWKSYFASKVLNSDWVIELKSASSVGDN